MINRMFKLQNNTICVSSFNTKVPMPLPPKRKPLHFDPLPHNSTFVLGVILVSLRCPRNVGGILSVSDFML